MSTPDITKAISDNPIKNGGSLLHINKTGIEITFDNSRDIEPGLDALSPETTDRFDDRLYYGVSSGGVFSNPSGIAGASSITNIVSISQTDYDALVTKNSSTLYIIS